MTCTICETARVTGSWPKTHKGTHCDGCHRSWAGAREAHCAACHKHFSADSVFSRHLKGGRCLTTEEMLIAQSEKGRMVFRATETTKGLELWRGGETLNLKPHWVDA